jgi:Ca2+-binding RTX toxin-like protein
VDDSGDILTEGASAGTDLVRTTLARFSLGSLDHIENLTFTGTDGFSGTGNGLSNTITGGAGQDTLLGVAGNDVLNGREGADTLDGGLGVDTMTGGLGDDDYYVDSITDKVVESTGQGHDEIVSSVTFTLASNLEDLTLVGAVNGTGNGLANTISGSDLTNTLLGGSGNDLLIGADGDDSLDGQNGSDRVIGGEGNDTLSGLSGNDVFVFAGGFGSDKVNSFDFAPKSGQDLLDVSAFGITAATFDRVGLTDLGADILVTIDRDAGQTIRLVGAQTVENITAQDFILA